MAKRKGKRTTGQITVNLNRGWLRLRFPQKFRDYLEERGEKCPTYLSLFLKEVDPETQVNNWPLAEAIAAAINQDWLSDDRNANLDLTLQKYLGQLHRQPKDQPNYPFAVGRQTWTSANDQVLLKDIWESYLKYHLVGKKTSTQQCYENYSKKLTPWFKFPIDREVAREIRNEFITENTHLAKQAVAALACAVNWAIAEEIYFGANPFLNISQEIHPQKRVDKITGLPIQFVAFTSKEVELILQVFLKEHIIYYPYFKFKFLTGCRSGEARALTWKDVKFNQQVIHFNKTHLPSNNQISSGTKGRGSIFRHRQFPMNQYLYEWLRKFKPTFAEDRDLVFANRNGNYLNQSALSYAWGNQNPDKKIGVVARLALEGRLNYLPPYNTRHTFVNFCLDNGIDSVTIANWCGNSDSVIQEVYKSRSRNVDLTKMPQW